MSEYRTTNPYMHPMLIAISPDAMYNEKWVQDLIQQLRDYVGSNYAWLGLDANKAQRVLDYACGDGTMSEVGVGCSELSDADVRSQGLAPVCPKTVFRGIDILPQQVTRFNEAASKLLGGDTSRMYAVQGDLYDPSLALQDSEWYNFDVAVTSMALHHFADPVDMLRHLGQRVESGGAVVVTDWLNEIPVPRNSTGGGEGREKKPYHPTHNADSGHMMDNDHGDKVWAGFTIESIKECMAAAGLRNTEVKLHPELSKMPESLGGDKQIFYAKAYVL